MTNLDELLDEAENEPVESQTVQVCISPTVARKRAELLKQLEAARKQDAREAKTDQRLGGVSEPVHAPKVVAELEALEEKAARAVITLKFPRMAGDEWALLTSAFPMRIEVALDRHYGYDFDAVTRKAAEASGVLVTDEGEQPISLEQWARMWPRMSGHDVEQIRDVIFTLNEYGPSQYIEALVKGFGAA